MALKNGKNWIDTQGNEVPPKYVSPYDKKRDALVERNIKRARKIEAFMKKMKTEIYEDVENYRNEIAEMEGLKKQFNGNMKLTDFSGLSQIELSRQKLIGFDERLQTAKQIIDNCIAKWGEGANDKIRVIAKSAFDTDNKNMVNRSKIFALTRYDFKDNDWNRAVELIRESVFATGTKDYIRFLFREEPGKEWETIGLNFSSIEV